MGSAAARSSFHSGPRVVSRVDLYRLLADPGRLQVLALCSEEELSVGELAEVLRDTQPDSAPSGEPASPAMLAHLAALGPVLPGHRLAVDVGTGEGLLIDVLAPMYERVIAVDRSPARLAQCAQRVASRGFHHVSLFA